MAAKPNDDDKVKACFHIAKFNSEAWLASLAHGQASEYLKLLEKNRNIPKQIESTVSYIKEFKTLQDCDYDVFDCKLQVLTQ